MPGHDSADTHRPGGHEQAGPAPRFLVRAWEPRSDKKTRRRGLSPAPSVARAVSPARAPSPACRARLEASSVVPRLTSAHPPRGVGQPLGAPDDHGAAFTQRGLGGFPNAPRRRGQSIHPAGLAGSFPQAMTGSVLSTVLSRHRVRERRVRRSNCWGAIADRGFLRFLAGNLCTRQLAAACVWFLTGARTG